MAPAPEILVVGNYCHDTLVNSRGTHEALGGSAAYISSILEAFGARFNVVAKAGPDFKYAAELRGAPPRIIPGTRTTHFIDDYSQPGERRSVCDVPGEPIRPEDLAGGAGATVGMACGIAGEVLPATLHRLKALTQVTVADAQGLLRRIAPDGEVRLQTLDESPYRDCLGAIDFLKASREEARHLDINRVRTLCNLIVTEGAAGSVLYTSEGPVRIPAFPAEEVDSTGAGDCFLAGFAFALVRGLSAPRALRLGNRCGAIAVSQLGVPRLGGADFAELLA